MNLTGIDWADMTINPYSGCSRRCRDEKGECYCYAEAVANKRLKGRFGYPADDPFRVALHPDKLLKPPAVPRGFQSKNPSLPRGSAMIFLGSMGDFFDKDVPQSYREECLAYIRAARKHVFIILTKQVPLKMNYPTNLWLGVSIDGTSTYWREPLYALQRLVKERHLNKAVLSFEPLLSSHLPASSLDEPWHWISWVIMGADSRYPESMKGKEWLAEWIGGAAVNRDILLLVKDNLRRQKCIADYYERMKVKYTAEMAACSGRWRDKREFPKEYWWHGREE